MTATQTPRRREPAELASPLSIRQKPRVRGGEARFVGMVKPASARVCERNLRKRLPHLQFRIHNRLPWFGRPKRWG